ncbi:MAG: 50S ribosomal protein L33 [Candidatus Orphnella occulta]|nr:50S ribosomal protein L33 [Candidatus Orphnella occulta]
MREQILLACTECKNRWYSTTKNKKNTTEKLEMSKFCKFCHRRTPHKEVK